MSGFGLIFDKGQLSKKRVAAFFFEKSEVNFSPFWLHRHRTKCRLKNLISLLETPGNFTYLWWFSKKNINFKLAKIGIVQKIRETDFVQNSSLFVQMKIVDELSIVNTWKGCQKKAHVIFLLPVSKIFKIHPYLTVLSSKAIVALILGLPVYRLVIL